MSWSLRSYMKWNQQLFCSKRSLKAAKNTQFLLLWSRTGVCYTCVAVKLIICIPGPAFSLPHFPVLHFPVLHSQSCILQYCIFGSSHLTSIVEHFLVLHFMVPHFQCPHIYIIHQFLFDQNGSTVGKPRQTRQCNIFSNLRKSANTWEHSSSSCNVRCELPASTQHSLVNICLYTTNAANNQTRHLCYVMWHNNDTTSNNSTCTGQLRVHSMHEFVQVADKGPPYATRSVYASQRLFDQVTGCKNWPTMILTNRAFYILWMSRVLLSVLFQHHLPCSPRHLRCRMSTVTTLDAVWSSQPHRHWFSHQASRCLSLRLTLPVRCRLKLVYEYLLWIKANIMRVAYTKTIFCLAPTMPMSLAMLTSATEAGTPTPFI